MSVPIAPGLSVPLESHERGAAMSVSHTPGPWRVTQMHDGWEIEGPDNGYGSTICVSNEGREGRYNCRPETTANARLIAAAPDMLAELRYIVAYSRGGIMPTDLRDWMRRADAAIAKATRDDK